MKMITIILKTTSACNFRCLYCFHEDMGYLNDRIDLDDFEKICRLSADEYDTVVLVWHGGEPMMAGLQFFNDAMDRLDKVKKDYPNKQFVNQIQTNLSLLNDKWLDFFVKYDFHIGVSFDGPCNTFTRDKTDLVLKNMKMLYDRTHNINVLGVISSKNIDLLETYKYFEDLNYKFSFNPIFKEGAANENDFLLISPEEFIVNVKKLFDYWVYSPKAVDVRLFTNYLYLCMGVEKRLCYNGSCLGKWISIHPDGTLYPCSHYSISSKYCIGNIREIDAMSDAFSSDSMAELMEVVLQKRRNCMKNCDLFYYCQSNCPASQLRNMENGMGDFECITFKGIFPFIREFYEKVKNKEVPIDPLNPLLQRMFASK